MERREGRERGGLENESGERGQDREGDKRGRGKRGREVW